MTNRVAARALSASERVERLTSLMQAQMEQFKSTREIKWKVNIALWTFLAIVASGGNAGSIGLANVVVLYGGAVALTTVHCIWMYGNQCSLDYDKAKWGWYRERIDKVLSSGDEVTVASDPTRSLIRPKRRWVVLETLVTLLLSLAAVSLMLSGSEPAGNRRMQIQAKASVSASDSLKY
mgnify:CR=1 FL=1